MNCNNYKRLISEYGDGALRHDKRIAVERHLRDCPECAGFAKDVQAMSNVLRGLPIAQASTQFDARLASRIAQMPIPRKAMWRLRAHAIRPALATGVGAAIIGGMFFWNQPVATHNAAAIPDRLLVTHCVQQHRSYVGAQPLSDVAAQTLANQLDQTLFASDPTQMPKESNF